MNIEELAEEIDRHLFGADWLSPSDELRCRRLDRKNCDAVVALYRDAFTRGDWFGAELGVKQLSDVTRECLAAHLNRWPSSIAVIFTDRDGLVLGSTALFLDSSSGVLIDETQIDPVRGRRRGLMTQYFHHLIPFLNKRAPYWTEFVLTPQSRVLRRVLVRELDMQVTGIRPGVYSALPDGRALSALVAYGPGPAVREQLRLAKGLVPDIDRLLDACAGISVVPRTDRRESPTAYVEVAVPIVDRRRLAALVNSGYMPVVLSPSIATVTLARWPELSYEPQLYLEDLSCLRQLLELTSPTDPTA